jgi:ATP-dependent Clp protease ATP-binding subunit ClpA
MSRAIVFMTSNLGAAEMSEFITGGLGFAPPASAASLESELDAKIYKTALEASKRKFSPEFMNRRGGIGVAPRSEGGCACPGLR